METVASNFAKSLLKRDRALRKLSTVKRQDNILYPRVHELGMKPHASITGRV